ncbi:MAG: hypothetical protein US22_C0004G0008 [candidate division TM6 bacterium GW2011_GWF2_36_6]|nr:MAG: hypothetical protein US22_C0004G0008 [candidate division TM6 bacterium GW2011_GWF2_36_6]
MNLFNKTIITNTNPQLLENLLILHGKTLCELQKHNTSPNIQDHEFKVFSQNGEDGIIQYLIEKYNITNKTFIEFGVENYTEANTKFLLQNNNWSGLIIDGSPDHINAIKKTQLYWKHDITALQAFITQENINDILTTWKVINGHVGILSIDIDGVDYWVFKAITTVTADILIMEYNSTFGPNAHVTVPYDPLFDRTQKHFSSLYCGASIGAITKLANQKGYALVGSNSFGNNLFFINQKHLPIDKQTLSQTAWVKSQFRESRDNEGNLTYLNFEERQNLIANLPLINTENNTQTTLANLLKK